MLLSPAPDVAAERAVLAGICHFGNDAYFDVCDILKTESFTVETNQVVYKCIQHIFDKNNNASIDFLTILSAANELNLGSCFNDANQSIVRNIFATQVKKDNIRDNAKKVRKLHVARQIVTQLYESIHNVVNINGTETINNILSLAETPIFSLSDVIEEKGFQSSTRMGEGVDRYIEYLIENPVDCVGIPTGWSRYDAAIGGGLVRQELDIIAARLKVGKALKNGSLVQTPSGPIEIQKLKIGDEIFSSYGTINKVTGVFPQGIKDIYRIIFQDGDYVECCSEHLWEIKSYKSKNTKILSVADLLKEKLRLSNYGKQHRFSIRLPESTIYEKKELVIPAYVMGVILGDGCISGSSISITNTDDEILDRVRKELTLGIRLTKHNNKYGYGIIYKPGIPNPYTQELKKMNLFGHKSTSKFIPDIYKKSSIEDRLAIVQGLMDTDGTASKYSSSLSTTSYTLAMDFKEIIDSLGMLCKIKIKRGRYKGKEHLSYRCSVHSNDNSIIFSLTRKKNLTKKRIKANISRKIEKIELIGQHDCTCISTNSSDKCFLTNNFVVTHNSQIVDEIGVHISSTLNIPVLNVDTEMSQKQHWNRILAKLTGIDINEIKTGQFASDEKKKELVKDAGEKLRKMPYYYECVNGFGFEDILSIIRRWIIKVVGFDKNGNTNNCVVIFDYFKTMDANEISDSMKEYQLLGFKLMLLKNLCVKYDIPCLAFAQTNRDGITKEDTGVIGDSDRIARYASSISLFKEKSDEEIQMDGLTAGNMKLVPLVARNGPGIEDNNYINIIFQREKGKLTEGKTHFELMHEKNNKNAFPTTDKFEI